jgi:hypothetical protein
MAVPPYLWMGDLVNNIRWAGNSTRNIRQWIFWYNLETSCRPFLSRKLLVNRTEPRGWIEQTWSHHSNWLATLALTKTYCNYYHYCRCAVLHSGTTGTDTTPTTGFEPERTDVSLIENTLILGTSVVRIRAVCPSCKCRLVPYTCANNTSYENVSWPHLVSEMLVAWLQRQRLKRTANNNSLHRVCVWKCVRFLRMYCMPHTYNSFSTKLKN